MYSIYNFKKMAEFQVEFNRLKDQNDNNYHSTIYPALKTEVSNLFNALKDFFKSNGLEIADITNNKYQAIYLNSIIEVEKDGLVIVLKIGSEKIDVIKTHITPVKYNAPQEVLQPDKLESKINELQKKLLSEKGIAKSYDDLKIKFINESNVIFENKEEVIKRYFGN